ncbi:aspartate carbamoyltransferase catalytic subunit [Arenimonas sp. GDDSR-1]|uniref:aspartate carbamoyltransferase catalytic subunit n=1 Tax=Arenimonas sp. GDDSR-1 TaxID=2950125 RepID=UPI00261C8F4A|nr:aspartate carbamoyltransferase catalytic subunit [Arenimonas sp. GDDSR-1]
MTLRHLLSISDLDPAQLRALLDRAQDLRPRALGGSALRETLQGRTVCPLFFEASTRTRSSFMLAATRLGADVLPFDAGNSSGKKGETAIDTMRNLEAMGVDCFIVRTAIDGELRALVAAAKPETRFINAGDGRSNHPTQALLDMLTIRQHKGTDFSRLKIVIAGDILHSRVARSGLQALKMLGCGEIRVCGPDTLMPRDGTLDGCTRMSRFDDAVAGADVLMMLRLQRERMEQGLVGEPEAYFAEYGLDLRRLALAAPDAIVMHPGPMNRGVEIADEVADGARSVILEQVSNGVAVRMAVLQAVFAA